LTFSKYRYKIFNKKGLEISLARGKNRKRLMVLVTFSVHLEEVLANPDVMPENVIINIIKTTFFNGRTDTYDVLKYSFNRSYYRRRYSRTDTYDVLKLGSM